MAAPFSHDVENSDQRINKALSLVRKLSRHERLQLIGFMNDMNDPLAVLPAEIVFDIFSYLPVLTVWQCQRVNRRWHTMLSSDSLLKPTVSRWEAHYPRGSELPLADTLQSRVRRLQALRIARPFYASHLDEHVCPNLGSVGTWQMIPKFALKGPWIAYVLWPIWDTRGIILRVRHLIDGTMFDMPNEGRNQIIGIVLTTHIVAYASYDGYIYVAKLSDHARDVRSVRLPSSRIRALSGDAHYLAIIIDGEQRDSYLVVVYNHETGASKSFLFRNKNPEIGGNSGFQPQGILLNRKNLFIDIFSSSRSFFQFESNITQCFYAGFQRFSWNPSDFGQMISEQLQRADVVGPARGSQPIPSDVPSRHTARLWEIPMIEYTDTAEFYITQNGMGTKNFEVNFSSPSKGLKHQLSDQAWKDLITPVGEFAGPMRRKALCLLNDTFCVRFNPEGQHNISIYSFNENIIPRTGSHDGLRLPLEERTYGARVTARDMPYFDDFMKKHLESYE